MLEFFISRARSENMQKPGKEKEEIIRYYDQEAASYEEIYTKNLADQEFYPANAIRLDIVIDRMKARGPGRVLDVGCGTGHPLLRMLENGIDGYGFDFSPNMVACAKRTLEQAKHDPNRVVQADLENGQSLPDGPFDSIVALGVFPHNLNDSAAYANLRHRLAPGGVMYIEYRNALMALFSINKYSSSFFWDDLLRGASLPDGLQEDTLAFLARKFDTTVESVGAAREIEYSDILAKFHNPLTLDQDLRKHGLKSVGLHYYHFHCAPPHLEKRHKDAFWRRSLKMERSGDWRGMFMCSAFVAELVRDDE